MERDWKTECLAHEARRNELEADRSLDVEVLFIHLAHGDDEHRRWLYEALTAIKLGNRVPLPTGKANWEAERDRFRAALIEIRDTCWSYDDDAESRPSRIAREALEPPQKIKACDSCEKFFPENDLQGGTCRECQELPLRHDKPDQSPE